KEEEPNQVKGRILTGWDGKDANMWEEPKPETMRIRKQVTTEQVEKRLADELCWMCGSDDHIGEDCAKEHVHVVGRAEAALYWIQQATTTQGPDETLPTPYEEWRKHCELAWHECQWKLCTKHQNDK